MYGRDLTLLSCKNLRNEIDLFECDGKDMLKKLREHDRHSILFLNISKWQSEVAAQTCHSSIVLMNKYYLL
jgi:hypothetical protein